MASKYWFKKLSLDILQNNLEEITRIMGTQNEHSVYHLMKVTRIVVANGMKEK